MKRVNAVLWVILPLLLVLLAALWYYPLPGGGTAEAVPYLISPEEDCVNLNTATVAELSALPGIGETKALAIAAYRLENGEFTDITQLLEVHGIGPVVLEGLQSKVCI